MAAGDPGLIHCADTDGRRDNTAADLLFAGDQNFYISTADTATRRDNSVATILEDPLCEDPIADDVTMHEVFEVAENSLDSDLEMGDEQCESAIPNYDPNLTKLLKKFKGSLPRKAKRLMKRINKLKSREIDLRECLIGVDEDHDTSVVVDSGTVLHVCRDANVFKTVTKSVVRIRGVNGVSNGFRGVLKPSVLGVNLHAVLLESLPVECLLSTEGLKSHNWDTHFTQQRDYLSNSRTLEEIELTKDGRKLPSFKLKFYDTVDEMESSNFVCSPCVEAEQPSFKINTNPVFSNIPKRLKIPKKKVSKNVLKHPKTPRNVNQLLQHQRMCHMHNPDSKVRCFDCLENKGKRGGADKVRAEKYKKNPLVLFSGDFFGKVSPPSIRGNVWSLVFICDACAYAHVEVLERKAEAPEALERFAKLIRSRCGAVNGKTEKLDLVFAGIHTDNEPVLKGHRWKETCNRLNIQELHSIPYVPQTNGTIERFIGTIKDALRTTMCGVDARVWDWAVQHATTVWNMRNNSKCTPFNQGKLCSPDTIVSNISCNPFIHDTSSKIKYLRRFGCLSFLKPYRSPQEAESARNQVLLPKRLRGIHLGFSPNNSAYLIGTINAEGKFSTYESRDVTFCEDILVHDVRALSTHPERSSPPLLDILLDSIRPLTPEKVKDVGTDNSVAGSVPDVQVQGLERTQWEVPEAEQNQVLKQQDFGMLKTEAPPQGTVLKHNIRSDPIELDIDADPGVEHADPHKAASPGDDKPLEKGPDKSSSSSDTPQSELGRNNGDAPSRDGVTFGPTAVPKRKRGRPPGSKDRKPRKIRARETQQRNKKKKKGGQSVDPVAAASFLADEESDEDFYAHLVMEEGESLEEAEVFLAVAGPVSKPGDAVKCSWAFSDANPEKPRWIEAQDLEQTRLLAYETWRKLTEDEEAAWKRGELKATPTALILNRKRCGRYKARLVVLGNRWTPDGDNNVYASVVSQTGNRVTLVQAAKEGFEVAPFDIGNAFIRAGVGDLKIVVNIPVTMQDTESWDTGRRMLLKALYGLPISPRLWAKCLGKDLQELGWKECKHEPGVWIKVVDGVIKGYLTVYVDDCVLACRNKVILKHELDAINDKHPLTLIKCDPTQDGGISFDLTGADIEYNALKRTVKISMKNYIKKMLARFDMSDAKARATPSFEEKILYDPNSVESKFPFKAAVGALQWATTCARPDIAHSVNMLARAGANKCTKAMERCARLVFRYLVGTSDHFIAYTPEIEAKFKADFKEVAENCEENGTMTDRSQVDAPVHVFSDASFGVEFKSMKSISGNVIYFHGCPVAWRSKVQSVFTSCTTQSEWVSMANGIQFSSTTYGLKNFLFNIPENRPPDGPLWGDNRGAILNARKGVFNQDELSRASRHIALRYANVLDESARAWWVPTHLQLADGLTKSTNRAALDNLVQRPYGHIIPEDIESDENEVEECYIAEYLELDPYTLRYHM